MKNLKINSLILGFALLATLLTSCKTDETTPKTSVSPTKLELTLKSGKKAEATVSATAVDLTTIFNVTFTPTNTTDKTVTWSLKNDSGNATLTTEGKLTAKSAGKVTVIATSKAKLSVKDEIEFTIKAADGETTTPVTGITVTTEQSTITVGATTQFTAKTDPEGKTVTWSVDNTDIATIDENGLLTAVKIGTVTVKAKSGEVESNGTPVTIEAAPVPVPVTGVTTALKTDAKAEFVAGKTLDLSMTFDVTVEPNNATDKAVTWSISDAGNTSATIDGNNLTATTAGTIKVKATVGSKSSADLSITVKATTVPVATVTTALKTDAKAEFVADGTLDLSMTFDVTVAPNDATDKTVTWVLVDGSNANASITDGKTLTATTAGTVMVKATAGGISSADISITVKAATVPVATVTTALKTDAKAEFVAGETLDLSTVFNVTVKPDDATDKTVTWVLVDGSNANASINGNNLTATTAGTVMVKATAGGISSADVSITVKALPVPSIKMEIKDQFDRWSTLSSDALAVRPFGANASQRPEIRFVYQETPDGGNATDISDGVTWSVKNGDTAFTPQAGLTFTETDGRYVAKIESSYATKEEYTLTITATKGKSTKTAELVVKPKAYLSVLVNRAPVGNDENAEVTAGTAANPNVINFTLEGTKSYDRQPVTWSTVPDLPTGVKGSIVSGQNLYQITVRDYAGDETTITVTATVNGEDVKRSFTLKPAP